jgi:hypothetical protein
MHLINLEKMQGNTCRRSKVLEVEFTFKCNAIVLYPG